MLKYVFNVTGYYSILYFPTLTITSVKSKTEKKVQKPLIFLPGTTEEY